MSVPPVRFLLSLAAAPPSVAASQPQTKIDHPYKEIQRHDARLRKPTPSPGRASAWLHAPAALSVAGCGGGTKTDEAVVVPAPDANLPTAGASAPASSGGATTPAAGSPAASSSTAAAPTKADGWGTLKGQVTLKGTAPKPKELAEKGKAAKDPEVCAVGTSIVSERVVVDEATKGVKNVLVYIPKPTAVNDEAKSNAQSAQVIFQ